MNGPGNWAFDELTGDAARVGESFQRRGRRGPFALLPPGATPTPILPLQGGGRRGGNGREPLCGLELFPLDLANEEVAEDGDALRVSEFLGIDEEGVEFRALDLGDDPRHP